MTAALIIVLVCLLLEYDYHYHYRDTGPCYFCGGAGVIPARTITWNPNLMQASDIRFELDTCEKCGGEG